MRNLRNSRQDFRSYQKHRVGRMLQENNRVYTSELRAPYYQLSDALQALKSTANDLRDTQLQRMVARLLKIDSEIYKYLDNNYIWD